MAQENKPLIKILLNNMFSLFTKLSKKKSDVTIINPSRLKGKIFIEYCREHETFIFIIRLDG